MIARSQALQHSATGVMRVTAVHFELNHPLVLRGPEVVFTSRHHLLQMASPVMSFIIRRKPSLPPWRSLSPACRRNPDTSGVSCDVPELDQCLAVRPVFPTIWPLSILIRPVSQQHSSVRISLDLSIGSDGKDELKMDVDAVRARPGHLRNQIFVLYSFLTPEVPQIQGFEVRSLLFPTIGAGPPGDDGIEIGADRGLHAAGPLRPSHAGNVIDKDPRPAAPRSDPPCRFGVAGGTAWCRYSVRPRNRRSRTRSAHDSGCPTVTFWVSVGAHG